MLKTFNTLESLLAEVHHDRQIEGEGAYTANRFPVRFVLFDNFRDCCAFIEDMAHLPNVQILRMEKWMDSEYPDTMLTHLCLADNVRQTIAASPAEYRIIMPFSELARFYNNTPEKAEFNSLIATVKAIESSNSGFQLKQRVYIPIVGLEGKMQHFRDDSQSFIWYYRNPDRQQDYRLILTNRTTYGVKGLEGKYTIASDVTEWLRCWKFPELKDNIISISRSIFSHAKYAQPDNAFTYCACSNAYEFLTKGLQLDVSFIDYREEDSVFWEQLAKMVDVNNFHFETFFKEQFGIFDLRDYRVFYQQWFEHKQPFMRWLLAKYYTHKFCNEGYICRVLNKMDTYNDSMFMQVLSNLIFSIDNPEPYLEERMIGMELAAKYGVEIAHEVQNYIVEKICEIANTQGVLSAIPYLSCVSYEEKALIIRWYCEGKIGKEQLKVLYPDLYAYLQPTVAETPEPWVLDYIDRYKEAKIRNEYSAEVKEYIETKNQNELEHFKWTNQFSTTRTLLYMRDDISRYIWIDGLGIDWIPFIEQIVKEREQDGYYLNEVKIATAKLPTRTDINKEDIIALSGGLFEKIGDLDEVAHTNNASRAYPHFIIDDLEMLRKAINKMLTEHPNEKIAIVSDHGMTYLSQLCDGMNLAGYASDHCGRVAIHKQNGMSPVKDNHYVILPDQKMICALRHESLLKKIAINTGCHGGCTPEEQLVPIFVISNKKESVSWTASQCTFDLAEANPVFEIDILNVPTGINPQILYNGIIYSLKKVTGNHYVSARMSLNKDNTIVTLIIGHQQQDYKVSIKMSVEETDLFDF